MLFRPQLRHRSAPEAAGPPRVWRPDVADRELTRRSAGDVGGHQDEPPVHMMDFPTHPVALIGWTEPLPDIHQFEPLLETLHRDVDDLVVLVMMTEWCGNLGDALGASRVGLLVHAVKGHASPASIGVGPGDDPGESG